MEAFRIILVSKVGRSRQSGPLRGPRHPQRVPRVAPELPSGAQSGPRDPPRVPNGPPVVPLGYFGLPLGGFWGGFGCLLGSFGTPLGVSVATFSVKRLNSGKPRNSLEKRSPGAHGGGQEAALLGVLGPNICPKSTHGAPKRAKGQAKTSGTGSRGQRRGQRSPPGPPNARK